MKHLKLFAFLLLASSVMSLPALADQKDDRIAALEKQMRMMMQELQILKTERTEEKEAQVALKKQVYTLEQKTTRQLANISPAAGNSDFKIEMKPGPKISKGDLSWQPFGRLHLDTAAFNDDRVDHPDGAEFRRARIGMKGTVAKDLGYKAELEFANEGVGIRDVYINYTGFDNIEVRAGSFKPAMGLEELGSSNALPLIERSAITTTFAANHIIGLGAIGHGENWSLAGGIFNDDAGVQSTDDESLNLTARATWAPINTDNAALHLGVASSFRKPDQASNTFDFDSNAENSLQSADSVSAVITTADSANIYGLESAASWGPLTIQGEYYDISVDNNAGADLNFDGAYAQAMWVVTGERRPYSAKKGFFGRIVPDKPLDPSRGDWGAVEFAARYSTIDLTDGGISGGVMDNYTLGANWYLSKHVRLMANYIMVDTDSTAPTPNDDPNILLFRTQVDF